VRSLLNRCRGFSRTGRRERVSFPSNDFEAIYAVGDVHGCFQQLQDSVRSIIEDARNVNGKKLIVFLGDYVDRGPDSRSVIEYLLQLQLEDFKHIFLCGNHDDKCLRFLREPSRNMDWLNFGGETTLQSYGLDIRHVLRRGGNARDLERFLADAIPPTHLEFLTRLPVVLEVGRLVFVHAGIRPGIQIDKQRDHDLLSIREPFISQGPKIDTIVVHGHTSGVVPTTGPNRIGIDTAVFATGRLAVLRLGRGGHTFLS